MQQRTPPSSASKSFSSSSSSKCIVGDQPITIMSSSGFGTRRRPAQMQLPSLTMAATAANSISRNSLPAASSVQRVQQASTTTSNVGHHQHQHHTSRRSQQLSSRQELPANNNYRSTTSSSPQAQQATVLGDEMPVQFVTAMRTLFDIMDDQSSGFVRLQDIERRWQDDGAAGQPHGVIDSLRKVTPSSGLLSFERFCAGLKICLLRNQHTGIHSSSSRGEKAGSPARISASTRVHQQLHHQHNTAAVRPNRHSTSAAAGGGAFPMVHRALSMPKLCVTRSSTSSSSYENPVGAVAVVVAPPKPPRTALVLGNGVTNINHLDQLDKAEIRHALQTWQMGILMNEMDAKEKRSVAPGADVEAVKRGTADGGSTTDTSSLLSTTSRPTQHRLVASRSVTTTAGRRHEPRRHTLQNGIDYNLLKQLKLCEQEKDLLVQGMESLNAAREWYVRQLAHVQDRIKLLGKSDTYQNSNAASNVYHERLHIQRVRIAQASQQLVVLTDDHTAIAALPQHMHHLAVRHTSTGINPPASRIQHDALLAAADVTQRLKEKNRQLGEDVTEKSQYIAMLERERKTLIRELLQAQRNSLAGGRPPQDGSARLTAIGTTKRSGENQVKF